MRDAIAGDGAIVGEHETALREQRELVGEDLRPFLQAHMDRVADALDRVEIVGRGGAPNGMIVRHRPVIARAAAAATRYQQQIVDLL